MSSPTSPSPKPKAQSQGPRGSSQNPPSIPPLPQPHLTSSNATHLHTHLQNGLKQQTFRQRWSPRLLFQQEQRPIDLQLTSAIDRNKTGLQPGSAQSASCPPRTNPFPSTTTYSRSPLPHAWHGHFLRPQSRLKGYLARLLRHAGPCAAFTTRPSSTHIHPS